MADEESAEDQQANSDKQDSKESSGVGKKKILLLAAMGLVLVGVSVGGTLAVISMVVRQDTSAEKVEEVAEDVPEQIKRAIYYPLKPSIIVSFDAKGRQRFVQADLTLTTRDNDVIAAIETHMPMIRNALVMLISGQLFEELQTAEGKELLRVQCLQELQRLLEQEIGKPGVEQVLFTNLVMQ